jgi:hypothetical protein
MQVENISENMNIIKKEKKEKKEIISPPKSKKKVEELILPTKENYMVLMTQNYTLKQLKEIVAHYKIRLFGASTKADITSRICNYFKLYDSAVVLQKAWRCYLLKQYNRLRGPARFNRRLCVNDTDFFTMDSLQEIPYQQFYSFMDADKMIYGFDIMSLYNLFKQNAVPTNPYNRNGLPYVGTNIEKLLRLSKIFNETVNLDMNEGVEKSPVANFETRLATLFNDIDRLGNYTNYNWLLSLNHVELMRFLMVLNDIWTYRANLSETVKREIYPEHRELFRRMTMVDLRLATLPILREIAIDIMNKLVYEGINHDSRCLGANFVLCALTLVNHDAADALPWLYESVI